MRLKVLWRDTVFIFTNPINSCLDLFSGKKAITVEYKVTVGTSFICFKHLKTASDIFLFSIPNKSGFEGLKIVF